MTADGNAYSEQVKIRVHESTKNAYNPRKGIDIIWERVNMNEPEGGTHEYIATLVGSDVVPEEKIEQRDLTNVLSQWRSIVSDRVRVQNKKPLKHTILTNIDRPKQTMSDQLKSQIDALDEKDIIIDKEGKRLGHFVLDIKD